MKTLLRLAGFLLVGLLMLTAAPETSWAGKKKSHKKEVGVDTSDRISAVGLASITVAVFSPSSSKQYRITPETKITVNGKAGTAKDLTTGMNVSVTPATDPGAAAAIDARTHK